MNMPWWLIAAALTGCSQSRRDSADPSPPPVGKTGTERTRSTGPVPPVAPQRPHDVVAPSGTRNDPYYWLRDDTRKDPTVLAHLRAENAYTQAVLAPHSALIDAVYAEMRSHIQEDDSSVPQLDDGYWYYTRFETGKQHPIHARKKATLEAPEEILLDGNELARPHAYYRIGQFSVSRDDKLLAWTEDSIGRNQYSLRVKNLATGELYPDTATNIATPVEWASDNKTLFYVGKDPVTLRTFRIFRHALGGSHDLVFEENDTSYYVDLGLAKSKRYLFIGLTSTTTSEFRLIDAAQPAAPPRVFIPRSRDHEYSIDHLGNRFVMRTNADARNFRLVEVAPGQEGRPGTWKDLIPHRADAFIERQFALYDTFVAAAVRTGGLRKIQVVPARQPAFFVDANDASYVMNLVDTPDPSSRKVRYDYDAMQTPTVAYELDIATRQRVQLKQKPVPGYDESKYASEYLHATASDGTKVPISVFYRKDTPRDGTAPLLIQGYGSYGISQDPYFAANRLSLLDRGWIFALAHVRGGQEMGRGWYEAGKLLRKVNTFTDFIAATEHLIASKYGARDQVFASGRSAGGLLMGAIANLRPDLYRGLYIGVPFVDVVTTMLDESIPLTTNEFDEWGNPKHKLFYDYMLGYSPYDNIKPQRYPAMFVHTGLWDSQVQYFEPAKWVAKLRATKTDDNPIVLDLDMSSGHGGAAGRFDSLRQSARAYAFLLALREQPPS